MPKEALFVKTKHSKQPQFWVGVAVGCSRLHSNNGIYTTVIKKSTAMHSTNTIEFPLLNIRNLKTIPGCIHRKRSIEKPE